jgi:hypothetical protein
MAVNTSVRSAARPTTAMAATHAAAVSILLAPNMMSSFSGAVDPLQLPLGGGHWDFWSEVWTGRGTESLGDG